MNLVKGEEEEEEKSSRYWDILEYDGHFSVMQWEVPGTYSLYIYVCIDVLEWNWLLYIKG